MHQIATHRDGMSFLFFYAIHLARIVDKLSARNLLFRIYRVTLLAKLKSMVLLKLYSSDAVKPREYLLKAQSNHSNDSTVRRNSMSDTSGTTQQSKRTSNPKRHTTMGIRCCYFIGNDCSSSTF
jgi:hypothetical protein